MVLAEMCHKLKFDFAIAHCNFKLRDEESDADEAFVLEWGDKNGVETFTQQFDTRAFARENGLSIQMAARELRYKWFEELAEHLGFDHILTAHHADDALETFFINLFRGTGLDGLRGIPERNNKILRPLLEFSRQDIWSYAETAKVKWREDSSNTSSKYLRNRIRKELSPVLKSIEPDILNILGKTQSHLEESAFLLSQYKHDLKKKLFKVEGDSILVELDELNRLKPLKPFLYLLFAEFGFTQWKDFTEMTDSQSGKQIYSSTHRLLRDRNHLILKRISKGRINPIPIPRGIRQLSTPAGYLEFEEKKQMGVPDALTLYADRDKLKFPLVLRNWEEGDLFYPSGMNGKKKLSKFFKDEKLSLFQKEKTLILCSDDEIVWIVGHRADRRFIADGNTVNILKIQLN